MERYDEKLPNAFSDFVCSGVERIDEDGLWQPEMGMRMS